MANKMALINKDLFLSVHILVIVIHYGTEQKKIFNQELFLLDLLIFEF